MLFSFLLCLRFLYLGLRLRFEFYEEIFEALARLFGVGAPEFESDLCQIPMFNFPIIRPEL